MDLILWSFALQLWVLIWVDFIKTYLFGKLEVHQEAAGASRGINKTISSQQSTVKACLNFLVAVASVTEPNLRGLETAVVQGLWGLARVSRAKEVVSTVLSKGHRVSRIMQTRYERLLWLACLPCWPGVTQIFAEAFW